MADILRPDLLRDDSLAEQLRWNQTTTDNIDLLNATGTTAPGPTGATGPAGPAGAAGATGATGATGAAAVTYFSYSQGTVSTTDGTATTILTIPVASAENLFVQVSGVGRRSNGSGGGGTVGFGAGFRSYAAIKDNAGTRQIVGSSTPTGLYDSGAYSVSWAISGNNVLFKVTGEAGSNIDWQAVAEILRMPV